jgi:hypothetical protein
MTWVNRQASMVNRWVDPTFFEYRPAGHGGVTMTRRFMIVLMTGLVAVGLAAPAYGGAVTKVTGTSYDLSCVFETREGPLVFFFASEGVSGDSGSGMFVENPDGEMVLS